MSLYTPDVVTLWAIQSEIFEGVQGLFEFPSTEDDEPQASPFARAYRLGWFDTDFAELHSGASAAELLSAAAQQCRTLDEQAVGRLPAGDWNGLYLVYRGAGDQWSAPETRPPMPHGVVDVDGVKFQLVDSFHVLIRP
ncbi:immunity 22 family protein (plasmid) [Deinococcus sp. KNUC1210]|uniref:immunity 22 family protein n=1 Tax=Deinococcus sp. KNUC1210 TaxID=2917691 RepID=UPI001EF122E2|nr:immunity 22 family protein [Deinococcus sp. KNUC1210]ULH17624.1 immunity 22 family protein [Deinococcus sp. KNUC1210]